MSVNLTVICQACSARVKVHRDLAGKQVRCSKCGQVFSVPSDNAADGRHEWYYAHGGTQSGPVSRTELNRLVNSGAIGAGDLLWRDGLDNWVPASSVSGLIAAPVSKSASPATDSVTVVPRDDRRPAKSASKSASPAADSVTVVPRDDRRPAKSASKSASPAADSVTVVPRDDQRSAKSASKSAPPAADSVTVVPRDDQRSTKSASKPAPPAADSVTVVPRDDQRSAHSASKSAPPAADSVTVVPQEEIVPQEKKRSTESSLASASPAVEAVPAAASAQRWSGAPSPEPDPTGGDAASVVPGRFWHAVVHHLGKQLSSQRLVRWSQQVAAAGLNCLTGLMVLVPALFIITAVKAEDVGPGLVALGCGIGMSLSQYLNDRLLRVIARQVRVNRTRVTSSVLFDVLALACFVNAVILVLISAYAAFSDSDWTQLLMGPAVGLLLMFAGVIILNPEFLGITIDPQATAADDVLTLITIPFKVMLALAPFAFLSGILACTAQTFLALYFTLADSELLSGLLTASLLNSVAAAAAAPLVAYVTGSVGLFGVMVCNALLSMPNKLDEIRSAVESTPGDAPVRTNDSV